MRGWQDAWPVKKKLVEIVYIKVRHFLHSRIWIGLPKAIVRIAVIRSISELASTNAYLLINRSGSVSHRLQSVGWHMLRERLKNPEAAMCIDNTRHVHGIACARCCHVSFDCSIPPTLSD
jgi:hypothetical protein